MNGRNTHLFVQSFFMLFYSFEKILMWTRRKVWLRGGLSGLQGNITIQWQADILATSHYSIIREARATQNKSPDKGYKEKGPTGVIQTELSEMGYTRTIGELDTGDLWKTRNRWMHILLGKTNCKKEKLDVKMEKNKIKNILSPLFLHLYWCFLLILNL